MRRKTSNVHLIILHLINQCILCLRKVSNDNQSVCVTIITNCILCLFSSFVSAMVNTCRLQQHRGRTWGERVELFPKHYGGQLSHRRINTRKTIFFPCMLWEHQGLGPISCVNSQQCGAVKYVTFAFVFMSNTFCAFCIMNLHWNTSLK